MRAAWADWMGCAVLRVGYANPYILSWKGVVWILLAFYGSRDWMRCMIY